MAMSGLVFSGANQEEEGSDALLFASELSTLDLRGTELVVLSACLSGMGETENGEGVYGMRRGLELAGARRQVVTLREVDDQATMQLMKDFYSKLAEGLPASEALREAKLAMMRSEQYSQPKYWAPFILSGDWR